MTLVNFLKENQSKLKNSQKLNVRDFDELDTNTFVAYVDQGNESFDVQVKLDSSKKIIETNCDCEENGICNHIIALANFIAENKTEKPILKRIVKKKKTETDEILETLDNESVRIWLSEILNKNKELAFTFKNQFLKNSLEISNELIKNTIQQSIMAIVGKRKKIVTSEVKKIVDNLNVSLKPIIDTIFTKFSIENYQFFKTMVTTLNDFHNNHYLTSNRILKLIENLHETNLKSIFNIKDFNEWQKATSFYINLIFKDKIYLHDIYFAENIYEFSKTNELQKKYVVNLIIEQYEKLNAHFDDNIPYLIIELNNLFLKVFAENNLIEKHITKFKPRKFQNEYNLFLINELVKINNLILAEKYCLEQISNNFYSEFDMPYVKLLIEIYTKTNENSKLTDLLSQYGKFSFSINNYNFVKKNSTEEKFKKYRIAILKNANIEMQNGNEEAFDFYYEVKLQDNKPEAIFDMFITSKNIKMINKYNIIAFNLDKMKFLQTLLNLPLNYTKFKNELNEIVYLITNNIDTINIKFYLNNANKYHKNLIYIELENFFNS